MMILSQENILILNGKQQLLIETLMDTDVHFLQRAILEFGLDSTTLQQLILSWQTNGIQQRMEPKSQVTIQQEVEKEFGGFASMMILSRENTLILNGRQQYQTETMAAAVPLSIKETLRYGAGLMT